MSDAVDLGTRLTRLARAAKRAEEVAADARAARDDAIAQAEDAGWTLQAIAARVELSVAQVGRIAVVQAGRRQPESIDGRLSTADRSTQPNG